MKAAAAMKKMMRNEVIVKEKMNKHGWTILAKLNEITEKTTLPSVKILNKQYYNGVEIILMDIWKHQQKVNWTR